MALAALSHELLVLADECEGWAWDNGSALDNVVDAVVEVTIDVLLAFNSFWSFLSAMATVYQKGQ